MMPNLRSLVAKAYRVRQGRAFCSSSSSSSSSSSAPNPIGAATYSSGDKVAKYEEKMKAIDNDAWETLALLYLDMSES